MVREHCCGWVSALQAKKWENECIMKNKSNEVCCSKWDKLLLVRLLNAFVCYPFIFTELSEQISCSHCTFSNQQLVFNRNILNCFPWHTIIVVRERTINEPKEKSNPFCHQNRMMTPCEAKTHLWQLGLGQGQNYLVFVHCLNGGGGEGDVNTASLFVSQGCFKQTSEIVTPDMKNH